MKNKDLKDVPLSESNVSLKLALIQRRCEELLSNSDGDLELSLEDYDPEKDDSNPYARG